MIILEMRPVERELTDTQTNKPTEPINILEKIWKIFSSNNKIFSSNNKSVNFDPIVKIQVALGSEKINLASWFF